MKSRSLEYFWKGGGGKSHKSFTSSSPTSRGPPIHESEDDGVEEPPIQQSANENDEENEQQDPNSMSSLTTPQSSMRYTGPNATYDVDLLPHDLGKRMSISAYPSNERDAVRRGYILKKPFRPYTFDFPQRELGDDWRKIRSSCQTGGPFVESSVERQGTHLPQNWAQERQKSKARCEELATPIDSSAKLATSSHKKIFLAASTMSLCDV